MSDVQCALLGCGVVGSGVVRLWRERSYAPPARLAAVAVRDLHRARAADLSGIGLSRDPIALARDPRLRILIEATGDADLAYAAAVESFERGKSFVTASKVLVARHGAELERHARDAGAFFGYEAAAAGAVPVVGLLRHGLSPGPVRALEGVLNGTCNFILSRLAEAVPYEAAVDLARRAGLAEADPSRDTSGRDSADKLVILARLCGVRLPDDFGVRGIEGLRPGDVAFGAERGWALRLVARFHRRGGSVVAGVEPVFVEAASVLAQARDEENAVVLESELAGRFGLVGPGAGGLPTAAAMLADVREALAARATASRPEPEAVSLADDVDPAPHYLGLKFAFGHPGPRRVVAEALSAAGIGVQTIESDRPGGVQALTFPAPTAAVERVLRTLDVREVIRVPVRARAAAAAVTGNVAAATASVFPSTRSFRGASL
jgi:homoserine dehydrogenase